MNSRWLLIAYVFSCSVAVSQVNVPDTKRTPTDTELAEMAQRCDAARIRISADISALTGDLAKGCKRDADCALIDPSISCQSECNVAILTVHGERSKALLEKLAAARCSREVAFCAASAYCAPIMGTRCVEGTCRVLPQGLQEPGVGLPGSQVR